LTAEQLEAARAERMRQNGHGAITIEDVRTWIEETGLCIFLPRSAQAGQSIQSLTTAPTATPTFVEAVAGQRTNEPTLELIAAAESLLVRLEAEGVAVRLNLAGQPGDQPDYVVAGWVLPYIYALRGDRDWRRSPQLTGSRQVSQLAVLAAKQLDSANLTAAQIRDALGREVTETAVLRALHELWKQLRIIPVVPEVGAPALWQPLRQRFQKAIAEGASTSQVTAISVLASIYLQAVIAASMEDVEMFLSPLTSRSKIREVVRGLAATRQVHSTTMGHSPMYYVAGTLPEFPVAPSFQISPSIPSYRGSSYLASYLGHKHGHDHEEDLHDSAYEAAPAVFLEKTEPKELTAAAQEHAAEPPQISHKPVLQPRPRPAAATAHSTKSQSSGKSALPRPRTGGDRRRAPMPRSTAASGSGARSSAGSSRPARNASIGKANGTHTAKSAHPAGNGRVHNGNGSHAANGNHQVNVSKPTHSGWSARPATNGNGHSAKSSAGARPVTRPESRPSTGKARPTGAKASAVSNFKAAPKPGARSSNGASRNGSASARPTSRPAAGKRTSSESVSRKPTASAAKRYSFSGQAKQAPKPAAKRTSGRAAAPVSKAVAPSATKSRSKSAHPAASKRRG
jgi:23S rRNA pseudouridine2605 synthase